MGTPFEEKRQYFYAEISEVKKAEFINGEILIHAPTRLREANAIDNLLCLLDGYVEKHHLGTVGHGKLLITLARNDYEPDICFFGTAKAQHFTPDQTQFPAPDLVVEVLSDSTAAIDRGLKFEDYALHGVAEYWIIDPEQESIEQYVLRGTAYELAVKVKTGTIQSNIVSGFEIPVRAVFDSPEQIAALQAILA
ncbi:MAG TPA: Uma2 family endonuclease [Aggregatilineaceae bacterium]|nr:Uma2 family endonuclease [Aggregatilineaceae bacterium]